MPHFSLVFLSVAGASVTLSMNGFSTLRRNKVGPAVAAGAQKGALWVGCMMGRLPGCPGWKGLVSVRVLHIPLLPVYYTAPPDASSHWLHWRTPQDSSEMPAVRYRGKHDHTHITGVLC